MSPLRPPPRDFRSALFKFGGVPAGQLPHTQDLPLQIDEQLLDRALPGRLGFAMAGLQQAGRVVFEKACDGCLGGLGAPVPVRYGEQRAFGTCRERAGILVEVGMAIGLGGSTAREPDGGVRPAHGGVAADFRLLGAA